jgi:hypothetical protein
MAALLLALPALVVPQRAVAQELHRAFHQLKGLSVLHTPEEEAVEVPLQALVQAGASVLSLEAVLTAVLQRVQPAF